MESNIESEQEQHTVHTKNNIHSELQEDVGKRGRGKGTGRKEGRLGRRGKGDRGTGKVERGKGKVEKGQVADHHGE